jgi:hypothetical protein
MAPNVTLEAPPDRKHPQHGVKVSSMICTCRYNERRQMPRVCNSVGKLCKKIMALTKTDHSHPPAIPSKKGSLLRRPLGRPRRLRQHLPSRSIQMLPMSHTQHLPPFQITQCHPLPDNNLRYRHRRSGLHRLRHRTRTVALLSQNSLTRIGRRCKSRCHQGQFGYSPCRVR